MVFRSFRQYRRPRQTARHTVLSFYGRIQGVSIHVLGRGSCQIICPLLLISYYSVCNKLSLFRMTENVPVYAQNTERTQVGGAQFSSVVVHIIIIIIGYLWNALSFICHVFESRALAAVESIIYRF